MKPMSVHVVQTLVSGCVYRHWFQLAKLTIRFSVAGGPFGAFAFDDQLALRAGSSAETTAVDPKRTLRQNVKVQYGSKVRNRADFVVHFSSWARRLCPPDG
jgi:hypothetical protein